MPVTEIDESELRALHTNSKFLADALANPQARELVLRAQKALNPNVAIPELDAAKPLTDALSKLDERLAALDKKIDEEKSTRESARKTEELRAEWGKSQALARKAGYSGESLTELEKFMETKGIVDHEVAMPAFERLHPQQEPVTPSSRGFDFFNSKAGNSTNEQLGKLFKGEISDDQFVQSAVTDTLKEIRGQGAA